MESLAKVLVAAGILIATAGGLLYLMTRLGIMPGRLPGDIRIGSGNTTCVIALGTSLLLSILLTVLLNVISRLLK